MGNTETKDAPKAEAEGNDNNTAPAKAKPGTVRFRSRYARYHVAGVQFDNNVAVVDAKTAAAMKKVNGFGQGLDFWVESD